MDVLKGDLVLPHSAGATSASSTPRTTCSSWRTWDELYKNRSSGKTDSQQEQGSLGSPILLKIYYLRIDFPGRPILYNWSLVLVEQRLQLHLEAVHAEGLDGLEVGAVVVL